MFSRSSFGIESDIVPPPVPLWVLARLAESACSPVGLSPRSVLVFFASARRSFTEVVSVRGYAGSAASPNSARQTNSTEILRLLNIARFYIGVTDKW